MKGVSEKLCLASETYDGRMVEVWHEDGTVCLDAIDVSGDCVKCITIQIDPAKARRLADRLTALAKEADNAPTAD